MCISRRFYVSRRPNQILILRGLNEKSPSTFVVWRSRAVYDLNDRIYLRIMRVVFTYFFNTFQCIAIVIVKRTL